ncbi:hypothetical protein ABZ341_24020 [Streptomyces sp. NPDC006173]|uniref:hypothetical protein n=1 Tax=Streptomyces sp. NPDC006173 TaxID=3155349 RepID=UPI0033FC146E
MAIVPQVDVHREPVGKALVTSELTRSWSDLYRSVIFRHLGGRLDNEWPVASRRFLRRGRSERWFWKLAGLDPDNLDSRAADRLQGAPSLRGRMPVVVAGSSLGDAIGVRPRQAEAVLRGLHAVILSGVACPRTPSQPFRVSTTQQPRTPRSLLKDRLQPVPVHSGDAAFDFDGRAVRQR